MLRRQTAPKDLCRPAWIADSADCMNIAGAADRSLPFAAAPLADAVWPRKLILVTGGTGFVGQRLVEALSAAGHGVIVLSRNAVSDNLPDSVRVIASLLQIAPATRIDAVVNLAGESIAGGLWTRNKRARILQSRRDMAAQCRDLVARLECKPEVLITASAIGWYGIRGDETLDESSTGTACFSREICEAIEQGAAACAELGVRVVPLRIGLVLDSSGGMLGRMLLPFRLGLGGPFGSGKHWMSWIHRDDLVRLICHAIAEPSLSGPVNAVAPEPVRNRDFVKALGKALHRPAVIPVPAAPLKLVLGQFAEELLLGGQRVVPVRAEASGFRFRYPTLDAALAAIFEHEKGDAP